MNNLLFVIMTFLISCIAGYLSMRAIKRFMNGEIKQMSFEYQIFGFGGSLIFVFGMIFTIAEILEFIIFTVIL